MSKKTLAEAIVEQFEAWGVRYIFGVVGDDILPFLDAINKAESMTYIATAKETGAAFMASYYAKLTGELAVCVASAPGSLNLLEGVADAYFDGASILAITGQVKTTEAGTKTKQYFDQQRLFSNFATYSEAIIEPQSGIRLMIKAMNEALSKKTVAHLSVYQDLWEKYIDAEPASLPPLVSGRKIGREFQGDIERASELMKSAKNPLIVLGKLSKPEVSNIAKLSSIWGAAIVTTQEAKGVLPDTWPRLIGGIGQAWIPKVLLQSDCVLLAGNASYEHRFFPKSPIIQVQSYPWQIDDCFLWDSLTGDLEYILQTLAQNLEDHKVNSDWIEQIESAKEARNKLINASLNKESTPIDSAFLMATLGEIVNSNTVVAVDEGGFSHWFDTYFRAKNQEILISSYWRSMGLALPAAIAAQLKHPERQVVALVGDGCLLMSLGDLTTAVQYNLPITVIVIKDKLYSLEKDKAQHKNLNPVGLGVPPIDYALYAQACGVQGFTVREPKQLRNTLQRALELQSPSLVEVICEPVPLPQL